jgi:hypothetical protein
MPALSEPAKWCTLCSTETNYPVRADWEVAYDSGETALVSCGSHLGESVTMAMTSQSADHVTVYDLTRDRAASAG